MAKFSKQGISLKYILPTWKKKTNKTQKAALPRITF